MIAVYIIGSVAFLVLSFCFGYKTASWNNKRLMEMYKEEREHCRTLKHQLEAQSELIKESNKLVDAYNRTNNKLFEQLKHRI